MTDYVFKAEVLREHSDVVSLCRTWSRISWLRGEFIDNEEIAQLYETTWEMVSIFFEQGNEDALAVWRECEKICKAYYMRAVRLKKRISAMLHKGTCSFVTLTFNDDTLQRTSRETRRKYVTLFLKSVATDYCANIDFGKENGREHYHAVVMGKSPCLSGWDVYGFSNVKTIGKTDDAAPLAKYVAKLTNHAIKETTQRCAMIYSR